MISLIALSLFARPAPPTNHLQAYLKRPDSTPLNLAVKKEKNRYEIDFTSQTWQGIQWKHKILLQMPAVPTPHKTVILFITGDGPRAGDYTVLAALSASTGMPIAMLFDIPNQPIWNMKEDDLIAHTFEKYIESGDDSWPLLFPMAKSAIKAMDVTQTVGKENALQFDNFVVSGASKRGWTTWMTAASGDRRVIGIAPMVYNNLNLPSQMKHQIDSWGQYSEQIADYTRRGIQAKLSTPRGRELSEMVDPFTYRSGIKIPTMIVNGANDPYWTVDAESKYWSELKQPKWLLDVPNAGHGLEDRVRVISSVGAFARSLAGEFKMPTLSSNWVRDTQSHTLTLKYTWKGIQFDKITLWKVEASSLDFRPEKWIPFEVDAKNPRVVLDPTKNSATFAEFKVTANGKSFTVSTPVNVAPAAK